MLTNNPMKMARFFLFLIPLLFAAPACHGMQANGCDDYTEPNVSVKQLVISPQYNHTLDLANIRRLAIEGGNNVASGQHETPVGLTAASLKLDSRFQINIKSRGDDPLVCAQISDFELNFGFDDTIVYVASELPYGSCSYGVVLEHEMRHVQTDLFVVQSYLPILPNLLREAVRYVGTIRASSAEVAEEQIRSSISRYMGDLGKSLSQVRQKYQGQIDSKDEYLRISKSCDYALSKFVKDAHQDYRSSPSGNQTYGVPTGGGYYYNERNRREY